MIDIAYGRDQEASGREVGGFGFKPGSGGLLAALAGIGAGVLFE